MKIGSEEIKGWKDWTITLAACAIVYGGLSYCAWSAYQKYTTPTPETPYEEADIDIVLDNEASADYARAYSIAADLTETGEGALDHIRAARTVSIKMDQWAKDAGAAYDADRAAVEEAYEQALQDEHDTR